MRKFKLVTKYPGHGDLGIIVKEVKGYGYLDERLNEDSYKMYPNAFIPKYYVEDHPAFWEEVEELCVPVGTEFKHVSGPEPVYKISKVVGDNIYVTWDEGSNMNFSVSEANNYFETGKWLEKLFTTEDGVDVYEGDLCWAGYVEDGINSFYPSGWVGDSLDMKYFSTKKAAEEYINITFTLEEVVKIVNNWSMSRIDEGDILRVYEKIKK